MMLKELRKSNPNRIEYYIVRIPRYYKNLRFNLIWKWQRVKFLLSSYWDERRFDRHQRELDNMPHEL